ncbi:MAG: HEPN domain-containing protein [Agrobacterium cavarae]|uniref:HEPN domain-containing protein n=1 Tax=Agrobacterium sp. 22117 TaxID=3453880 RepID=UPI0030707AFA
MPSQARLNFERNLSRDVERLEEMHRAQFPGPGRPHSILTRSGIFLLCAAWELYCEEVVKEGFEHVVLHTDSPLQLPEHPRRTLANAIKADKHDLAVLRMAGEGWKQYLREHAEKKLEELNTPNCANVTDLFKKFVGIDVEPILSPHDQALLTFIGKRGDIAHRGAQAAHVSINDLENDHNYIQTLVVQLDNEIIPSIQDVTGARPWNRRNQ